MSKITTIQSQPAAAIGIRTIRCSFTFNNEKALIVVLVPRRLTSGFNRINPALALITCTTP